MHASELRPLQRRLFLLSAGISVAMPSVAFAQSSQKVVSNVGPMVSSGNSGTGGISSVVRH